MANNSVKVQSKEVCKKLAIANVAKGLEIARQVKHLVFTIANAQKPTLKEAKSYLFNFFSKISGDFGTTSKLIFFFH